MKYICWETFLNNFCEIGIIILSNFFRTLDNLSKFAEIMDARDETHIIRSCYAADWEKRQCHLFGSEEHLLIYQGRQLCYDNQATSVLVNFKLIEISFSLSAQEGFMSCLHASAYAIIVENWNYVENMHVCLFILTLNRPGGGGGNRLVLPSAVLKR